VYRRKGWGMEMVHTAQLGRPGYSSNNSAVAAEANRAMRIVVKRMISGIVVLNLEMDKKIVGLVFDLSSMTGVLPLYIFYREICSKCIEKRKMRKNTAG
jgi:hypothetical protein